MSEYTNPILYADYSDPDVIRVNDDYFMVASSFCNVPAIPLLHSRDLVHWKVVNYVLDRLPSPAYDKPRHGKGVWAPAIRHHNGLFYVMYPMPDEGIFCCTAKDPFGKWSEPLTVREGIGWIDPCPFWDDDGKAYMVSAFAKSRIGIKSLINLAEMKPDCSGLIDDGRHIIDGRNTQPTIEGPKMYKRNGWYYILAPAGGVEHGWQTALRSRSIWGPYEEKIVMFRGGTDVNGPHQGGLVDTPSGETWFIHFQDAGACGRIAHLQPVEWVNDWPVIGYNVGGDGCGQPVSKWKMPDAGKVYAPVFPAASDEFTGGKLGMQWQWNANPTDNQYRLADGKLRLFAMPRTGALCDAPHLLLQKYMAPSFEAVFRTDLRDLAVNSEAGLVVLGKNYGSLTARRTAKGLEFISVRGAMGGDETESTIAHADISGVLYFKLSVSANMETVFSYGIDGDNFITVPDSFISTAGIWVGAKFGFYIIGESGSVSLDFVHVAAAGQDL